MARFIALIDASALFSIRVTNLTLEVAKTGLFQPRWSATIHDEWQRALLSKNPNAAPDRIAYRRTQMDIAFPDAPVTAYEQLCAGLTLPDPKDVHVLAAAIKARADVIVTFNMKDFPDAVLAPHGLEAQHPDTFLLHQMTLAPPPFVAAASAVRRRLSNPPHSVAEFLSGLRRASLPLVADALAGYAEAL